MQKLGSPMVDGVSEKPERLEEAFGVRGSGRDGTLPGNGGDMFGYCGGGSSLGAGDHPRM